MTIIRLHCEVPSLTALSRRNRYLTLRHRYCTPWPSGFT